MSERKTIQINPSFLAVNSNNKKGKKEKPKQQVQVKTQVKQQFLNKIKDYQKKAESTAAKEKEKNEKVKVKEKGGTKKAHIQEFNAEFETEFNRSLHFLQELAKKKAEKKKSEQHNLTLKKGLIENQVRQQIATELPPELRPSPLPETSELVKATLRAIALEQQALIKAPQIKAPPQIKAQVPSAQVPLVQVPSAQVPSAQVPSAQVPSAQVMQVPPRVPALIKAAPAAQVTSPPLAPPQISINTKAAAAVGVAAAAKVPFYSNLKNGSKPTYRHWVRTTQKKHDAPLLYITSGGETSLNITERSKALMDFKQKYHENKKKQNAKVNTVVPPPPNRKDVLLPTHKKRCTRTLKYMLGKRGKKVSILIKNQDARAQVQEERNNLKLKTIQEIKDYLRYKNFIKAGTAIPNDILRQMYEALVLTGDVNNKSKDTLIHNYFNEKA